MFQTRRSAAPLLLALVLLGVSDLHAGHRRKRSEIADSHASTVVYIKADLNGATALPSNCEAASGDVSGTYDRETHVLRYSARFLNLSGPARDAKFHGPAAIDRYGSAVVASARPEARLVTGTAWLDTEEEQDLLEGRWYFNVTTEKHPQGEIRGMVFTSPNDNAL